MGAFDVLQSGIGSLVDDISAIASDVPKEVAIGSAVAGATALAVGGLVVAGVKKKKARKKKAKKKTKKGLSRDRKFRSKQKHELAYVKRKRKAGKKITRPRYKTKTTRKTKKRPGKVYYTKKGQPYKIMASGKARFIKGKRRKR